MTDNDVLKTSVVGSYSVPEWLERLKTDFYQRRISGQYLDDIHEVAIKAALKDQERTGVDIVSDGELRRDNDIDYFLARMPGVEIPHIAKTCVVADEVAPTWDGALQGMVLWQLWRGTVCRVHHGEATIAQLSRVQAEALGLERSHLYKKCQQLGIDLKEMRKE